MKFKVGGYTVTQTRSNGWRVEGQGRKWRLVERTPGTWNLFSSSNGRRTRKQFRAGDLTDAVRIAESLLFSTAHQSEHLIGAILGAWEASLTCTGETIAEYRALSQRFLAWVVSRGLEYWADLRLQHLTAYAKELAAAGLSRETIRKRTDPARRASVWASRNYPDLYHDWAMGFECPGLPAPPKRETLTFEQITAWTADLLANPRRRHFAPAVALCGICGLRVFEVFRLRWEDLDESGVLHVDGRKRGPSVRSIPLPEYVLEVLHAAKGSGKMVPYTNRNNYRRAFLEFLPEGFPAMPPKNLRKTLPTEAFHRGWHSDYLELYIGHTPRTLPMVTWKHYLTMDPESTIRLLRERVVAPLNEALEGAVGAIRGADNIVTLRGNGR